MITESVCIGTEDYDKLERRLDKAKYRLVAAIDGLNSFYNEYGRPSDIPCCVGLLKQRDHYMRRINRCLKMI